MISAFTKAFQQLPEPAFRRVLLKSIGLTVVLYGVLLWLGFASQGQGDSQLGATWVAELSATIITAALVVAATVWIGLTLVLARRTPASTAAPDEGDELIIEAPMPDF